jgi:hypothetical protein
MQFIVTLLLQIAAAVLLAPPIVSMLPLGRVYHVVYAVVLGLLVWIAGLLVAQVLKGSAPHRGRLIASMVGALIGVAVVLLPTFAPATENAIHLVSEPLYLVAGALAGYWVVR